FKYFPSNQAVTTEATTARTAAQTAQFECAKQVTQDYNRVKIAMLRSQTGSAETLLSPASTIAERRLKEQYCARLSACLFPDPQLADFWASFPPCSSEKDDGGSRRPARPRALHLALLLTRWQADAGRSFQRRAYEP